MVNESSFNIGQAAYQFSNLSQNQQIDQIQAAMANLSMQGRGMGRGRGLGDQRGGRGRGRGRGNLNYSMSSAGSYNHNHPFEERKGNQAGLSNLARRSLVDRKPLSAAEEANYVKELANMSFHDAKRQKESILNDVKIDMPLTFGSKQQYLEKLQEMIEKEAVIERLAVETVAEADIEFEFEEILEIYCRMRLRIPKTHQKHLRENTMLRVVIPILGHPHAQNYIGTGVIKRVAIKAGDPLLTITFQLDIVNPTDKNQQDQEIPKKDIQYG